MYRCFALQLQNAVLEAHLCQGNANRRRSHRNCQLCNKMGEPILFVIMTDHLCVLFGSTEKGPSGEDMRNLILLLLTTATYRLKEWLWLIYE